MVAAGPLLARPLSGWTGVEPERFVAEQAVAVDA